MKIPKDAPSPAAPILSVACDVKEVISFNIIQSSKREFRPTSNMVLTLEKTNTKPKPILPKTTDANLVILVDHFSLKFG